MHTHLKSVLLYIVLMLFMFPLFLSANEVVRENLKGADIFKNVILRDFSKLSDDVRNYPKEALTGIFVEEVGRDSNLYIQLDAGMVIYKVNNDVVTTFTEFVRSLTAEINMLEVYDGEMYDVITLTRSQVDDALSPYAKGLIADSASG